MYTYICIIYIMREKKGNMYIYYEGKEVSYLKKYLV